MPQTRIDALVAYAAGAATLGAAALTYVVWLNFRVFFVLACASAGSLISVTWSAQRAQGRRW